VQKYGARGYFSLNSEVIGNMEDIEVEIIDVQQKMGLKKEEMEDMLQFLNVAGQMAALNPQIVQEMNILGLLKQVAKKLDLDYYEVFPSPSYENDEDTIDIILNLLILGEQPDIGPLDPMKVVERIMKFKGTDQFKSLNPMIKSKINNFIITTSFAYKEYLKSQLAEHNQAENTNPSLGLGGAEQLTGAIPGQGTPQFGGQPMGETGGIPAQAATPPVRTTGAMAKRILGGGA